MFNCIILSTLIWVGFNVSSEAASTLDSEISLASNDRKIVKVSEDMYIGIKRLPYKESIYTQDRKIAHDDVYFVFERLTSENYDFWHSYHEKQEVSTRKMGVTSENGTQIVIADGIDSFKKSLDLFGNSRSGNYSIWIAYATRKDPRIMKAIPRVEDDRPYGNEEDWSEDEKKREQDYYDQVDRYEDAQRTFGIKPNDIEMTFTVFTDSISPITTHMGIFRNYEYFSLAMNPHPDLAMELHGFAALASQTVYPHVEYMVTNPAGKMKKLMKEELQIGTEMWIGDAEQRMKRQKKIDDLQHDQVLLEAFKDNKKTLTSNDLVNFLTLKANEQSSITKDFNKVCERKNAIIKYLETHSAHDLNEQMQLGWKSKIPGFYVSLYRDSLKEDIQNTYEQAKKDSKSENLLINKIKNIVDMNVNNFIYDEILNKLNSESGMLDFFKTDEMQYLPEDLSYMPPFDNRDKIMWSIRLPNDQQLSFKRPKWFGTFDEKKSYVVGKHEDLLNFLPTAIISIPALGKIWSKETFIP